MSTPLVLAIVATVTAIAVYTLRAEAKPPIVTVDDWGFSVKSRMYDAKLAWADIVALSLLDVLPKVQLRTNGYAAAGKLRGTFRLAELGAGKLFVDRNVAPYVLVKTRTSYVIVGLESSDATRSLHDRMRTRWAAR